MRIFWATKQKCKRLINRSYIDSTTEHVLNLGNLNPPGYKSNENRQTNILIINTLFSANFNYSIYSQKKQLIAKLHYL